MGARGGWGGGGEGEGMGVGGCSDVGCLGICIVHEIGSGERGAKW